MRDTWEWEDWVPLLNQLGCDDLAARSLALLAQRYDPWTPGRILQQWGLVLEPGKVKDVRQLQQPADDGSF